LHHPVEKQFLGWRKVPVVSEALGDLARQLEPAIYQIFIGRGPGADDPVQIERKLFVIRKVIERFVRESALSEASYFHIPSLSSQTLVYKGMLLADQISAFYPDLTDPDMRSALALVHQRYSTNTFPTWDLAHPFRFLCHTGEINTLGGNVNWMNARQHLFRSELFGDDMSKLFPIATPGASDSAIFDNTVELLYHFGRSLPHAIMMLIPEAWEKHETMGDSKKAFYEYHSCLIEPWDGPASIAFSDGTCIGAVLDRNGLHPSRYTVTNDDMVIMASETGVLDVPPQDSQQSHRSLESPGTRFFQNSLQTRVAGRNSRHLFCSGPGPRSGKCAGSLADRNVPSGNSVFWSRSSFSIFCTPRNISAANRIAIVQIPNRFRIRRIRRNTS
jgi:glutamate synthase domain-containing protein 1